MNFLTSHLKDFILQLVANKTTPGLGFREEIMQGIKHLHIFMLKIFNKNFSFSQQVALENIYNLDIS